MLALLTEMTPDSVDGVFTDPPYNSGGVAHSDRTRSTREKHAKKSGLPDFANDHMTQDAYYAWSACWLRECHKVTRPGGIVAVFTDWRQYAVIANAIQGAGWIWRGAAVWDKRNSRPQKGRYRQQSEFVIWGTKGPRPCVGPVVPGVFSHATKLHNRRHQTEKPLELMRGLLKVVPPGGSILDPFMGSGTTGEAAMLEGLGFTGIEVTPHYYEVAVERLRDTLYGGRDE